ncbi:hypothetical protein K440DRAFT_635686 [Wilcoxina mikolae CBS 423.85]|nr:hypothetical protein K440DRAFT_635686 [Wilcoxina mikolae CBS 423.85]
MSAHDEILKALEKKSLHSIDEFVKKVMEEVPPEEAEAVKERIAKLEIAPGIKALLPKDFGDALELIGKFIGGAYITVGLTNFGKAWWTKRAAAVELGEAFTQSTATRVLYFQGLKNLVAERAAINAIRGELAISEAATAEEIAALEERSLATEALAVEVSTAREAAAAAAAAVEEAELAVAEAELAAAQCSRAGLWGLVIGGIILAGFMGWDYYKQNENEKELKGIIQTLATSRLYSTEQEQSAQSFCSLATDIKHIARAFGNKDEKQMKSSMDDYIQDANDLQKNPIDLKALHKQFEQEDKEANQKTEDDPTFEEMLEMHKKKVAEAVAKAKEKAAQKA